MSKHTPKRKTAKRKTDNKMRDLGSTDFNTNTIKINRKLNKKEGRGELIRTMVHEENHLKHPQMKEKNIKTLTLGMLKKMTTKQKQKVRNRFRKN